MADNRPLPLPTARFYLTASLIHKARLAVAEYLREYPEEIDKCNSLLDQWTSAFTTRQ